MFILICLNLWKITKWQSKPSLDNTSMTMLNICLIFLSHRACSKCLCHHSPFYVCAAVAPICYLMWVGGVRGVMMTIDDDDDDNCLRIWVQRLSFCLRRPPDITSPIPNPISSSLWSSSSSSSSSSLSLWRWYHDEGADSKGLVEDITSPILTPILSS